MKASEQDEGISTFVSHLSEEWLVCRDTGHLWRPFDAKVLSDKGCYLRAHRCANCDTVRNQELSFAGAVLRTSYDYPEGYLSDVGRIVGPDRDRLRLESLQRALGKRRLTSLQRRYMKAV